MSKRKRRNTMSEQNDTNVEATRIILACLIACLIIIGISVIGGLYITRTTIKQYSLDELCAILEKNFPQYSSEQGIPLQDISSRTLGEGSRVTHVLMCNEAGSSCGLMLGKVKFQGSLSGTAGDQTVHIAKLEDDLMTIEVDSGEWKLSSDGGSTFKVIADTETVASNFIAFDNTTVFTPDADYEPATKKYVDDNAGGGASNEYGLDDNGTGTMATANYAASVLSPVFFKESWHWSAGLIFDTISTCALWEITNTDYSAVRLQIGVNASDQLYVTVGTDLGGTPGTTTYTYTAQALGSQETGVPIQTDISYDETADEIVFCINGLCGTAIAAATIFDNATTGMTDTINLGSSVDGRILFMAFGEHAVFPAESWKGITKEGAYPSCGAQWDFNEGTGTTLGDVCGSIDLTCDDGDWIEVPGGY
jgi:hypothetical protein